MIRNRFDFWKWQGYRFMERPILYPPVWLFMNALMVLIWMRWFGALLVACGLVGLGIWLGRVL